MGGYFLNSLKGAITPRWIILMPFIHLVQIPPHGGRQIQGFEMILLSFSTALGPLFMVFLPFQGYIGDFPIFSNNGLGPLLWYFALRAKWNTF